MEIETKLNEAFHSLPGSTVEEKKRNLNSFIRQLNTKILHDTDRRTFIKNITPNNKLESVFKVDLLLHYRIYDAVLELLKSGNLLYISMILKNWNFFKQTFQPMSSSEFVNDVLPYTSFTTRMKIINRLSKNFSNEEKADEFFGAIEEKYGILSAEVLLPCCSLEMIKTKILQYNLILRHRQLMSLWKRNNEFMEFYIDYLDNNNFVSEYYRKFKILKVIFMSNEELFWKLNKKTMFYVSFGKRLSKRVLRDKEHLLKDITRCCITFQKRQVYKQLRKNPEIFKLFVLQRTPDEMRAFLERFMSHYSDIGVYIYHFISINKRYAFLNQSFMEKFGCCLHDKPEIITSDVLLYMPEEIRKIVVIAKMKEDDTLVYLLRPEESVPYLMNKIKHCSDVQKRVSYICTLYSTCEFYKDERVFLDVLKYVEGRHRNDTNVLENFFRSLTSWVDIENLSVNHWMYIDRIEKLLHLHDIKIHILYFLEKRIAHRLNNNLDISEQITSCFELAKRNSHITDIFANIPKYRRSCILKIKKHIDNIEDQEQSDTLLAGYLIWIFQHNKHTLLNDHISIIDRLPLLRRLLKTKQFDCLTNIVIFYVSQYYEEFNPIVWEYRHYFFGESSLLSWYITHHKDELLNKIELIADIDSIDDHKKFLRYLSLHSFRSIPEKMSDLSVEAVRANESVGPSISALKVLSLMNQPEFLSISESSDPSDDGKINVDDPPDKMKFQETILKCLKHWSTPVDLLQVLSKFCVGDYLKYALQPLYSIISQVPERDAVPFLGKMHKSAVSVRKHAIHLSKFIYPFDKFCNFIIEESSAEKSASLKTVLFKKALEYAAKMPTSRTWELIAATMHGIDKDDVDAHDFLLKIEEVPEPYRVIYVPEAYALLRSNKLPEIRRKIFDFLGNIPPEVIDQLECDLLQTFLADVLFNEHDERKSDVWINLIFHCEDAKQNVLFDFALGKLQEYSGMLPKNVIDDKQLRFVKNLCLGFLKFYTHHSMVKTFATIWQSNFSTEIDIDSHYTVIFTLAYAESEYEIEMFGTKVHELLLKDFPDGGSEYMLELFVTNLTKFLEHIGYIDTCEFVESILSAEETVSACLISIRVLSLNKPDNRGEAVRYSAILKKLKERSELPVKIHFRKYLQGFETNISEKLKN